MKSIPLTRGLVALVDDSDFEKISGFRWHARRKGKTIYAARSQNGRRIFMHHEILGSFNQTDHRDLNGLNNSRENLRAATHVQNQGNTGLRKNNTSGFKGVLFDSRLGKWFAKIQPKGKSIVLGCYNSPEEAAKAYDRAAVSYFGDFARTNFSIC